MDIGVQVHGPYEHVLEVARVVQDGGGIAVSLPDHYLYGDTEEIMPAYDSFVQAAGLARDTQHIEIVMLVSPITFRHPAFYAKGAITIDEMSGGRFVLGIGAGWNRDEHERFGIFFPSTGERFAMLEDALGYLRQLLTDPSEGFESDRYGFSADVSGPRARSDLRILVGGTGTSRTPRLAGTFAGEYSIAGPEPGAIADRVERARTAAARNGRDPADLLVSASEVVLSGHTDREITANLGLLGERSETSGVELREMWERRGLVFRTWAEHLDRHGQYAEEGIDRVYMQVVAQEPQLAAEALSILSITQPR